MNPRKPTESPRMFSNLGKLPRTVPILALMLIAGISESIGLALFVPVIEIMNGKDPIANMPIPWLMDAVESWGLSLSFPFMLVSVAVLIIGAFALTYLQSVMLKRSQHQFVKEVRDRLFHALMGSEWHHLSTRVQGDVVNNLLVESQRYAQCLAFEVQSAAVLILIGAYLTMGGILSPEMLLIVFVIGIGVVVAVMPLMKLSKLYGLQTHDANKEFTFLLSEVFRGLKLIRVTGAEQHVEERFEESNEDLRRIYFNVERNSQLINFVVQSLPVIGLIAVIGVAFTVFSVPTSIILVFLVIVSRLAPRLAQLQQLMSQYHVRSPTIPAIEIMTGEAEASPDRPVSEKKIFESLAGGIVLENVSYSFPGSEEQTLEGISLQVQKGDTIALVGGSGAGKSTLVDMLVALRQPTKGTILVDGTPLSDLDAQSWRHRIGYVTQEITLFNDTLRNNLTFARDRIDDDALWQILKTAHLESVVRDMPDGLDTILGENGTRLSGGQRQRLALARALISKPDILLLDEATSALDPEVEHAITDSLVEVARNMTVVIVSHRLSTVRNAKIIYVMDRGRIIEQGTYDALIADDGHFAKLHRLQSI
jgi:ABC-type multidrug transport system fused ATPase/permease subunit